MTLRVTHYSGDRVGGAARAALRIHSALRRSGLVNSRLQVIEASGDDASVSGFGPALRQRLAGVLKPTLDVVPLRLAAPYDLTPRSAGWATRLWAREIDAANADIAHLHWICGGFLSIEEIGKIATPLVWTLHDMWAFCGAEHLTEDGPDARWRTGYPVPFGAARFDVDRWAWRRKKTHWHQTMHIVAPSRWLADCASQSELLRHCPVTVVPNPLDVDVYKPMDRRGARRLLNLPEDRALILFGAIKGTQLPYKGWDLLVPALAEVARARPGIEAVIFGQGPPERPPALGLGIHWMGHLHDDVALAALYSAADVLVIPSRQESFGQTGSEAQACGCPVVAFDTTGLRDVVEPGETGLLTVPYDPAALAADLLRLLDNPDARRDMGAKARARACELWSYGAVAARYRDIYASAASR